jgi:hypothetical protein
MKHLVSSTYKKNLRSPLERKVSDQLEKAGVSFGYESLKLPYEVPARKAKYTPDFVINNSSIIIETKGWFRTAAERQKMVLVKESNPHLDIRLIFQNASKPIYKGSPTSYAKWAEDNGFLWADKGTVPQAWLTEMMIEEELEDYEPKEHHHQEAVPN